jgi:DNA-directed RNA polymerase beta' subunit
MFTTSWDLYTSEEILKVSIGEITKDIGSRFIDDHYEKPSCSHYDNPKHDRDKCKLCSHIGESFEFSKESEGTLCDRRMGPRHKKEICGTCKEPHADCRGHFMHITLVKPIIIDEMLSIIYKLLIKKNKKIIMDKINNRFILENVIIKAEDLLPEYDKYVLQHLIVIPNCARPYEPFKKNEWRANDLTTLYAKILEANIDLRNNLNVPIVCDTKYLILLNAVLLTPFT